MKKIITTLLMVTLILSLSMGCGQFLTKQLGGSTTIDLPPGIKLVNVTWKDSNIWYLYRNMRADEFPETYNFKESSVLGVAEGLIIIKEHR